MMKKGLIPALIILVFLQACTDTKKIPEGILPKDKMESVLWDMLRTGEFLENFVFTKDTSVDKVAESEKWYNKVYAMHAVSKETFEKSFTYYKQHTDLLRPILDSLSRKEVEPDTEDLKDSSAIRLTDSLKKNSIPKFKKMSPLQVQ